jgi:hypothetical protein
MERSFFAEFSSSIFTHEVNVLQDVKYAVDPQFVKGSQEHEEYVRKREEKKAAGDKRWWQF